MSLIRKSLKRVGLFLFFALALLLGILIWNYCTFSSRQLTIASIAPMKLDESTALGHLQAAIRIPTISTAMARISEDSPLFQFREFVTREFISLCSSPLVLRTGIDFGDSLNPSMLLEWPGQDPELPGILLMSHFDVVPVESNSLDKWTHRPFSGDRDEAFIWGRGSLDCKHGVMAILESLSLLYAAGFQPDRTIYVALGHDEELGGEDGNGKMAEWLRSHGRTLHMILDEGGCIFTEFPGLDRPAALVGVAEKGILNVKLTVDVEATQVGHASMPPAETAVSILAGAVHRVQASPFPVRMDGGLRNTLHYLGPEMPSFISRLAISNLWLFEPLVIGKLSSKPSSNALLRTTIAATQIAGGVQPNVLPQHAEVFLNHRLLAGETVESVCAHLRRSIADDRVQITQQSPYKLASPVSASDSSAFLQLQQTIGEIYPGVLVAPFVLVGSTDTWHYRDLSENIFRFIPTHLSERDTQRFHGIDERISIEDYLNIIRFYHQFIRNVAMQ